MKNKTIRYINFFGLLIIIIILGVSLLITFLLESALKDTLLKFELTVLGMIFPLFTKACIDLQDDKSWKRSLRALERSGDIKNNSLIRISYAFLFRIQTSGGKYLLVMNSYGMGKYQPLGATYRMNYEEDLELRKKYFLTKDDKISTTFSNYRFLIRKKYLKKFYKEFNTKVSSKNPAYDEYLQSLSRFLPNMKFNKNNLRFARRCITPITYSVYFETYEMLLADIIEVTLSEDQTKMLLNLNKSDFCFASTKEIQTCGINTESGDLRAYIAEHTYKILTKYDDDE